jgi:hypothetical protein
MALTAAEKAEMAQLEQELKPVKTGGLSPDEQAEMQSLEKEVGGQQSKGLLDTIKERWNSIGNSPEGEAQRRELFAKQPARGQAELEQFANAATMGYLPQLQALAEPAMTGGLNAITGQNIQPDSYVDSRDANVRRMQQQQEEFPATSTRSGLMGIGAQALVTPGMGPTKSILGAAAKGLGMGAAQGALQNPGDTEGKVDPIQGEERYQNAKTGAKWGGLIGLGAGVGGKVGQMLEKAPAATKKAAEATAFKGSGAMLKDFRQAAGKNSVEPIGRFMLDKQLIKAGDTVEDVAEKALSFNKNAGKELDTVYGKAAKAFENPDVAQKMPSFNPTRDKAELVKIVSDELGDSVGGKGAVAKLSSYLDDLAEKYGDSPLPPRIANDVKGYMDEAINYSRNPLTKQPNDEKAFSAARKWLADRIEAGVDYLGKASGDKALAAQLKEANKNYGMSKQVHGIAKDRVQRISANNSFGLTDSIAGGAGGMVGAVGAAATGERDPRNIGLASIGAGLLSAAASKGAKTYGPGLMSAAFNKAAPMMEIVGAGGAATRGLMDPAMLSRIAVQNSETKLKRRKKDDKGGVEIPITEGYEQ